MAMALVQARVSPAGSGVDVAREPRRRGHRYAIAGLGGVAFVLAATAGLHRLRAAAPAVERAAIWTDTVRRGPLVREVLGTGTLVPEEIRWIAAPTSARVERVLVKPGASVTAGTVLLELANAELQLAALEADRQVAQADAETVNLQATLEGQRLAQESVIATLAADLEDARLRAAADQELSGKGFLSALEKAQTLGRVRELEGRLAFERKRLAAQSQGTAAQVAAQRAQRERLSSLAAFRRKQVDDLRLRAGIPGVLQELALQPGQSVAAGTLLAKVARPDRLQAQVRVPETQAKDVRLGQRARIDTRNGIVAGRVARIDPAAQAGSVRVDVALDDPLPAGARPDLNVEATIEIERLPSVLFVGRPSAGQSEGAVGLFKLDPGGEGAVRATVTLGRSSAKSIEIRAGLREGDRVILSDMSQWDSVDRIKLY
jgi:HlyD family secretion protein